MFHAFDEHDFTFYNTNDIADIVCTFINTGTCVHSINVHADMFICIHNCTHVFVYVYVYAHILIHLFVNSLIYYY
jgi:hypothetical protein